ncbi:MAG: hypothetical protein KAG97_05285 [Victivallales bacterium]|nr:hypothetical protein [Victivallales bacterium]
MNTGKLLKTVLTLLLLAPILYAISLSQLKINAIKKRDKLTDTNIIKNAPPVVAFVTIALGSFRGLFADILWLRSASLQEKGQYYEMVQLASWITKLQPRFTGATAYLAWNMAYNISVTCSSFEDRWRWVRKGIELIRDEALQYNPSDPILYKELGWIYQHKIGNIMDDANLFYKNRMAVDIMNIVGKTEIDWQALADAPKNDKEITELAGLDKAFWKTLRTRDPDFRSKYENMAEVQRDFKLFGGVPEKVKKALNEDQTRIKELDNYFRSKWFKEKYKMDPAMIVELNKKYGKLDWRLPEAHAIYWANMGIKNDIDDKVNIDCDRMISQSLKDAFMGGKLLMADPDNTATFMTVPNLALADAAVNHFREAFKRQESKSFNDAMRNFLKDVIVMMYTYGKYSKANKFLTMLRKEEPGNKKLRTTLDKFVIREWKEDVRDATTKQAMNIIGGLVYSAYYMYACGSEDEADGHIKLAEGVYNVYKKDHADTWERVGLPPFEEIKKKMANLCRQNLMYLKQASAQLPASSSDAPAKPAPTTK